DRVLAADRADSHRRARRPAPLPRPARAVVPVLAVARLPGVGADHADPGRAARAAPADPAAPGVKTDLVRHQRRGGPSTQDRKHYVARLRETEARFQVGSRIIVSHFARSVTDLQGHTR